MFETKQLVTLILATTGTALMFLYWREILEALRNWRGGGPRPPSHPLPSNDELILTRRRRRLSDFSDFSDFSDLND